MEINTGALVALVSFLATVSGLYLGWAAHGRERKRQEQGRAEEQKAEGKATARMEINMDYIKSGVDQLQLEAKDQGRRFDELSERVTRVEESSKQAHKRIDRIERNPPDGGAHD